MTMAHYQPRPLVHPLSFLVNHSGIWLRPNVRGDNERRMYAEGHPAWQTNSQATSEMEQ